MHRCSSCCSTTRTTVRELLVPSIVWAHVLGAGVDGFPFDALGGRPLTCSRGAASVAIAEWVLAVMLAFEKSLPESWLDAAPEHWNIAALGGLAGQDGGAGGDRRHRHRGARAGPWPSTRTW